MNSGLRLSLAGHRCHLNSKNQPLVASLLCSTEKGTEQKKETYQRDKSEAVYVLMSH